MKYLSLVERNGKRITNEFRYLQDDKGNVVIQLAGTFSLHEAEVFFESLKVAKEVAFLGKFKGLMIATKNLLTHPRGLKVYKNLHKSITERN